MIRRDVLRHDVMSINSKMYEYFLKSKKRFLKVLKDFPSLRLPIVSRFFYGGRRSFA